MSSSVRELNSLLDKAKSFLLVIIPASLAIEVAVSILSPVIIMTFMPAWWRVFMALGVVGLKVSLIIRYPK